MITRLIGRWWPPYLREELRMVRLDLGREQRKYDKLREAYGREVAAHLNTKSQLDRERSSAVGFGMARPADRPLPWQVMDAINQETAAKRLADGAGDQ